MVHEKDQISVMKPQGTYLLQFGLFQLILTPNDELHAKIHDQAKLILNRGTNFGKEGNLHARLNVAPFTENHPLGGELSQISVDFL